MLAASDPHSGSVIAKAAIASPARDLRQPFALLLDRSEQARSRPSPSPCMAKAKSASAL